MTTSDHNTRRRRRLLLIPGVLLLALLCTGGLNATTRTFAAPSTAPGAVNQGIIGFDSPQFHSKQYAYIDLNFHIQELSITSGQQWTVTDLTALTGAPLAYGNCLTGFDSPQFQSKQYAYVVLSGPLKGHVVELSLAAGGQWQMADLSARTQAPLARM